LVLFGDFAYIASPLTYEKAVLVEFMEVQDMALAGKNTAIGDGLARSIAALKPSRAKTRLIILLTDGKQNAGSIAIEEAVEIAVKNNIRIYGVGIGEDTDKELLELIAARSGGKSFEAHDSAALEAVYDTIDELETSRIKSRDYAVKEYFYLYPAAAALLALLLYTLLISRRPV
jgi:Ca-activated chloride channel family protein